MIENYLEAEEGILLRLKDQIADLKGVYGMADLASVRDRAANLAPCVCVVYDGDTIPGGEGGRGGQGEAQTVLQRWIAWLIVRNVNNVHEGVAVRAEAGPLMSAVIKALAGHKPGTSFGRGLRRTSAPRVLYDAGVMHIPVAFELPLITV